MKVPTAASFALATLLLSSFATVAQVPRTHEACKNLTGGDYDICRGFATAPPQPAVSDTKPQPTSPTNVPAPTKGINAVYVMGSGPALLEIALMNFQTNMRPGIAAVQASNVAEQTLIDLAAIQVRQNEEVIRLLRKIARE